MVNRSRTVSRRGERPAPLDQRRLDLLQSTLSDAACETARSGDRTRAIHLARKEVGASLQEAVAIVKSVGAEGRAF